jgi:hypothetical protein
VTVPQQANVQLIKLPLDSDNITNSANGAVIILDTTTLTVVDAVTWGKGGLAQALIYGKGGTKGEADSLTLKINEGTQPAGTAADPTITDINWVDPADSTKTQHDGSIIRTPNGADTNNADTDLKFTKAPTPGAPNTLQ